MAETTPAASTVQVLGAAPALDDAMMDDLLDKLRVLGYESDFCKRFIPNQTFKLLTHTFFTMPSENANAQFFYFTSLASWLMQLAGHKNFPPPGQFDDPTAVSTTIVMETKAMDLPVRDLAPNKIRAGHGEPVMALLTALADKALLARGFGFRAVEYPPPASDAPPAEADEGLGADALDGDDIEDRAGGFGSGSDDDGDDGTPFSGKVRDADRELIEPQVAADVWALEVERVAPSLQLGLHVVGDWRTRVQDAVALMRGVDKLFPDVRSMLERVGDDLEKALDHISKREQKLAEQFPEQVASYRSRLDELNQLQDGFNTSSSRVSGLSAELASVSDALDQVKAAIQEREERSSDTTPLIRVKDAVTKVRVEIREMSLRIGVLQHTVLHAALRQQKEKKGRTQKEVSTAAGGSNADQVNTSVTNEDTLGDHGDFSGYM